MEIGTTSGDESGDEDKDKWEGPTATQRAWSNCSAFLATILVVIGELFSEQNFLAVVVVGGVLTVINVLLTASKLDKAREGELIKEAVRVEDTALRDRDLLHGMDDMSIDVDQLGSSEDESPLYDYHEDGERNRLLGRAHHRDSFDSRRGNVVDEEEETQRKRRKRSKRRGRRRTVPEDEDTEEGTCQRSDGDGWERNRRVYQSRRPRFHEPERERQRERDKRGRSREKKSKKKKRVTIAPGSAEHIIIEEV